MEAFVPVFFVAVLGFIVFAFVMAIRTMRRAAESWSRVATAHGLQLSPGGLFRYPSVRGTLQGCPIVVDTFTRRSGKSRTTYTRFDVRYPSPLPIDLALSQQGLFSGLASLFGAQDLEIGDESFDASVVVKGADAEAIRDFLTPERKTTAKRLLDDHPGIEIGAEGLRWSKRGLIDRETELESVLEDLTNAAATFAGQPLTAIPLPATPEPAEVPTAIAAEPVVDLEAVAGTLFLEGLSSFEAARRFEAEHEGRTAEGRGTLVSTSAFSYDFVLGRHGTKAVIEVLRVPSAWRKDGEPVVAEIRMPSGAEERWADAVGSPVGFSGRLVKLDAAMRKLYLLDGALRET